MRFLASHRNYRFRDTFAFGRDGFATSLQNHLSQMPLPTWPSVFWLIARKTGTDDLQMKASVLEAAMPLGLTPYAMAS